MNKVRRKSLASVYELIERAKEQLEELLAEEEECRDNMPESLQDTERYERMEEACSNMEEAVEGLESALEDIELAME